MRMVSASFLDQKDEFATIEKFNKSNVDFIHFDVMDNTLVKKKHLLPLEISSYFDKCKKKIDVHLMVDNPLKYLKYLSIYNVEYVTIHYEIKDSIKYLKALKGYGFKVGFAIMLDTKVEEIFPYLDILDIVLIQSVKSGASGSKFDVMSGEKIRKLKMEIVRRGLNVLISVDGGVNDEVLDDVEFADILVSASYILKDLRTNIDILKNGIDII